MLVCFALAAVTAAGDARSPLPPRIDRLIAAGHPEFASLAAPAADDAEFVRRAYLDLAGTIPTTEEVRAFLADQHSNKRTALVNHLLDSPGYVRRMAWFLDATLMERRPDAKVPRAAWEEYLRTAVAANRPYDALARELLSNDGTDPKTRAAAKFFLDRGLEPNLVTRDIARIFLGRNLTCAQCHDHPSVDDYKQDEYYGIQAYVGRSFLFPNANAANAVIAEKADGDVSFVSVFDKDKKSYTVLPKMPGGKPIPEPKFDKGKEYKVAPAANVRPVPAFSRRALLADALTNPETRAFARNAVNRVWAMMMGRGIVHPLDWDQSDNPPSHPELLDLLTTEFVKHNHDLKWLVRQIALTDAYQRSSVLTPALAKLESVPEDRYLVANLKPLVPEQFAYAVYEATGQNDADRARVAKLGPKGSAAFEAAVDVRLGPRLAAFRSVFGSRPGETPDGFSANLDQTLFLKYNATIRGLLPARAGALAKLSEADAVAEELFLSVLSRRPTVEEKADVATVLGSATDRTAAMAELVWALLASAEFRFNH